MAKKKTGAKKVTKKAATTKATTPKMPTKPKPPAEPKSPAKPLEKAKPPTEPKPTESKVAPPVAPPKLKAAPPKATPVAKKKVEPKGSRANSWPGKEKGYPDPFHVETEYTTQFDRIFVLKKDSYIYKIYGKKKIALPLN